MSATAIHEAGHAVIARLADLHLVRVSAGEQPGVRTRFQLGSGAEAEATLQKLILVDLAGQTAECHALRGDAWRADEENAAARIVEVTRLRYGLEQHAELTDAQHVEAAGLLKILRETAAALVAANFPSIERVAAALAGGETLDQADVDALLRTDLT
jgi:hypothetical protein